MPETTNGQAQARIAELETELAKYVGKEPTIADEMAYLHRCLNAVYEVCDQAEKQATRWENPLPVPEWVAVVREAADGVRADTPDDRRRRIYIDGRGNAWLSLTETTVGPLAGAMWADETLDSVRQRTGGLHEIGRCW